MIWFFQAAYDVMRDHDRPNDHDGPRHFEYGLGLMVNKLLQIIAKRRGMESAEKAADRIIAQAENWKKYRRAIDYTHV